MNFYDFATETSPKNMQFICVCMVVVMKSYLPESWANV